MTNPTPTRAEVARYTAAGYDPGMIASHEGAWVSFDDYQALRERAEAAERHKDAGWDQQRYWCDRYVNKTAALEKALVAARRAEAAAWNDAIEAAAAWHQSEIARLKEQVSENNAYLARVGAASYDSDANRYCIDQISAHEQSVSAIRALRRAAPTEGEA